MLSVLANPASKQTQVLSSPCLSHATPLPAPSDTYHLHVRGCPGATTALPAPAQALSLSAETCLVSSCDAFLCLRAGHQQVRGRPGSSKQFHLGCPCPCPCPVLDILACPLALALATPAGTRRPWPAAGSAWPCGRPCRSTSSRGPRWTAPGRRSRSRRRRRWQRRGQRRRQPADEPSLGLGSW